MNDRGCFGSFACPMWRAAFEELYIPDIDKELQQKIAELNPKEFEETWEMLKKNGLWRGDLTSFKFFFGNHHRMLSKEETGDDGYNTHEWAAYVEWGKDSLTKKFISKVEFKLHPTFNPPKVTVNKVPLQIKRWGWGVFEIKIIIHWKKWMNKEPTQYTHMLSFDGDGKRNAFLVDVNKNDLDDAK